MSRGDFGAYEEDAVGFLRRKLSNDLVLVHPDNISNNDWVILLEAGTIIGPTPQRIRVARWMQEKKIVKKYDMFLRTKYFIVVEGYNPRIHATYRCPQLFRHDFSSSCRCGVREIFGPWRLDFSSLLTMPGWLRHRDPAALSASFARSPHEGVLRRSTCANPPSFLGRLQGSGTSACSDILPGSDC